LNQLGHTVVVYERDDRPGGLLMYGIPNMKLDKELIVNRRLDLMKASGIIFQCNVDVGKTIEAGTLIDENDAVLLATGATKPRDLNKTPGRKMKGIHFAMDFLRNNTKTVLSSNPVDEYINVEGKKVIVIGGGDTGNDCIGTALRQNCASVINLELMPQPPTTRGEGNPWPLWPMVFRVDYAHEEARSRDGKDPRHFAILTNKFLGDKNGNLTGLDTVEITWQKGENGRCTFETIPGTEKIYECDVVFLALGYLSPEHLVSDQLKLVYDTRGNYKAQYGTFDTSLRKVFAAGDCRRGQSLVVTAMAEGRDAAYAIDEFLMTNE